MPGAAASRLARFASSACNWVAVCEAEGVIKLLCAAAKDETDDSVRGLSLKLLFQVLSQRSGDALREAQRCGAVNVSTELLGAAEASVREGAAAELRDWLCEASIVAAESPPALLDSRLLLAARELAPPPRFFRRRRRPPGAVTIIPPLGLRAASPPPTAPVNSSSTPTNSAATAVAAEQRPPGVLAVNVA